MSNRVDRGVRAADRGQAHAAWRLLGVACALCAVASEASAQVLQTDAARTPLPQPVGTAELSLGQTYGYSTLTQSYDDPLTGTPLLTPIVYGQYYSPPAFPQFVDGDELTLSGLFKWRGEQINPQTDARISPGHFFPGCGFTAELVLRGGACSLGLGWYNVSATPPAASDIQTLIPGNTSYSTLRSIFVPLGWDNRDPRNLFMVDWLRHPFSSGEILTNPAYKGGDIAFALLGDPTGQCTQNKYSVFEHNTKNASGIPWVTALIYHSTRDPSAIYLAFEDLPMSTADWHVPAVPTGATIDGDFNDFVVYISGLGATSACPDPLCQSVQCLPGSRCVSGACVPSGPTGAAGDGGAPGGGGGAGTANGGSTTSVPSSDAGTSSGGASDSPLTAGNGSGGTSDPITGDGGMSSSAAGNMAGTSANQISKSGCSCRVTTRPDANGYHWLSLALGAAFAARRRMRQRGAAEPSSLRVQP